MEDQISVRWLMKSLAFGFIEALRRNRLAATLAAATGIVLIALAFNSGFDGLGDYRQFILPRLLRLEAGFLSDIQTAKNASGPWRGYYFENAHRQVRDI